MMLPVGFDYADLYDHWVKDAPPHSVLVEVGVYEGLSLRHLAHAAKAADKGLTVVGVDWGRGSPEHRGNDSPHKYQFGNLVGKQLHTLIAAGVTNDVVLVTAPSVQAARLFAAESVWGVFLDAGHTELDVLADIGAWWPKVCRGGRMAGHDWLTFPGVRNAVRASFSPRDWVSEDAASCWEVKCGR